MLDPTTVEGKPRSGADATAPQGFRCKSGCGSGSNPSFRVVHKQNDFV